MYIKGKGMKGRADKKIERVKQKNDHVIQS